jgi:hypothetical protein
MPTFVGLIAFLLPDQSPSIGFYVSGEGAEQVVVTVLRVLRGCPFTHRTLLPVVLLFDRTLALITAQHMTQVFPPVYRRCPTRPATTFTFSAAG